MFPLGGIFHPHIVASRQCGVIEVATARAVDAADNGVVGGVCVSITLSKKGHKIIITIYFNEIIESEYRTYIAPEMWGTHYFDANGHATCMDDCEEFVTQHLKELHFPFGSEADATLV